MKSKMPRAGQPSSLRALVYIGTVNIESGSTAPLSQNYHAFGLDSRSRPIPYSPSGANSCRLSRNRPVASIMGTHMIGSSANLVILSLWPGPIVNGIPTLPTSTLLSLCLTKRRGVTMILEGY